jgi:cell division inhibitor SepF
MSVLHKTMVWLGLVDDDEYYGEDDEYYADEYGEPIAAPVRQPARVAAGASAAAPPAAEPSPLTVIRSRRERDREEVAATPTPVVAAPRSSAVKPIPMPATRVHVMDPKGFNDAQEVGDRLKNGQPVILNLQGVDRDLQRRLIDFASGLAYALNGTMSKAADQVFLLTPSNVEVSDEEKERLQARGLYRTARP